ncbi:uncharacterized protein LOC132202249 [Neocloeon triangulifer]|uniref:uncharacterized protein LOC132202249 n=1 Tax=Neocloeon triangulifer TaxID=2078957 RepID=UPI00286F3425|nr:uncharacterized protein LOC132202249 [Neocloeon triangulifer]
MKNAALAVICFFCAISLTFAWKKPAPLTDRVVGGGDDYYGKFQGINRDDPFQTDGKWVCNPKYDLVDRGDDICCYKYNSYEGRCCTKADARNCFHVGHISHHIH